MKNRLGIIIFSLLFIFLTTYRLYNLSIKNYDKYYIQYENISNKLVTFNTSPRGRILDTNGKILVDNKGINTLVYNKLDNDYIDDVNISLTLSEILSLDTSNVDEKMLKTFYIKSNHNGKNLITKKEYDLYKKRKIKASKLEKLKYKRVDINKLNIDDNYKKASLIYNLINKGYSYEDKIIKVGITDEELSNINDLDIEGLRCELRWERTYPYGNTLKSIFGTIGKVPSEEIEIYKDKNISLNSIVGTSYLEKEYDDMLRGEDPVYKVTSKGLKLVKEGKKGKDLKLSIDIDKQLVLEDILKEEMKKAKKAPNSKNYNHSYVILGNPNTGEIITMLGLKINEDGSFKDITSNIINSSYTVGSVVKGATISVGYKEGLIKENEYVTDSCIKVYGVTKKCSWKRLGRINDLKALAYSSNYYQFLIATRLTNKDYKWNSKLNATKEHFDIYRNMLSSYGLGEITGIDLPNEKTGIKGKSISDDLILNLAIGQYDTYTPIELYQYISTLANNGVKLKPSIGDNKNKVLGKVELDDEKINRIKMGLKDVMKYGTGKNYVDKTIVDASGKTGTSESFLDTNGDGKIDTETISTAFVMYAPSDNPKYSYIIMSPNIATKKGEKTYKYSINLQVTRKFTKYLFEN